MLGECHAHVIMDGKNYKEAMNLHKNGVAEEVIHQCFGAYKAAGITFIRDGGDKYGVSKRAKELAPEYGIEYLTPMFAIHKSGHYGSIVGRAFETIREYAKLVTEVKCSGGDFIKIMVSGLIDFSQYGVLTEEGIAPELIKEMVHIAHEEGFSVMAHCNGARIMEAAADAGVDSIEHGAYSDEQALQAMVENHVIWTPTVSPIGNLKGGGRFKDEITEKIAAHHMEMIKKYVALDGRIALGSDAGAWRVPHVEGLWTELAYLKTIVDESHLEETEKMIKKRFSKRN
ncbi:MAG: amidohydrolase family protein [Lachnospiraceae bacterium]|nr:amidohydrolase family protein [Lachnospiraceae bacterium]